MLVRGVELNVRDEGAGRLLLWGHGLLSDMQFEDDTRLMVPPPETLDGLALVVGPEDDPHPGNLNDPILVCQLNDPFAGSYSFAYQNVQSSAGSTDISL